MINLWNNGTVWDKIYIIYVAIIVIFMIGALLRFVFDSSTKRLNFILDAQKAGRCVPGKLTCYTVEGKVGESHYKFEYMYVVDNKVYYTTYCINPSTTNDAKKDECNADILARDMKRILLLFYDKKNPEKVMCKAQIYTSGAAMHQVLTPKHNVYRDVDKHWEEPIDLRKY